ncbi:hypothetical protein M404DRAFT_40698, partial [Pisolithus tinctorius Marx 270]
HFKSGWTVHCLPCISYYPHDDLTNAFGFVDPNDVICGVHIIPAFHWGRTTSLLPPSIAHHKSKNNEDWDWYYVNIFVDHDMFMCFQGSAVGHKTAREATSCLL